MNDAQRRVNRIQAFRAELEALTAAGVVGLSETEREEIARYHDALLRRLALEHDVDQSAAAGQLSRGMRIAAFFAALALTAAVYSLVQRFWGRLDVPVQATLLCIFPLASLVGVELSAQRERTLYVAGIFAAVAFGTYFLVVFELSDLLNVPITAPALWGGALFGVALSLAYGLRVIFGAGLLVLLVALSGSVFQASGAPWTIVPEFPEIITAAAFLLFAVAPHVSGGHPGFPAVTRGVALSVGFAGLLLLSLAGAASLLPVPTATAEAIYQGGMLLMCTIVLVRGTRRHWPETTYVAAAALTLFLLSRYVDWLWDIIPRFVFFLLLAVIALAWLWVLRRLRARMTPVDWR